MTRPILAGQGSAVRDASLVSEAAVAPAASAMTSKGSAHGRFQRALQRRHVREAEVAAKEMGQLSMIDALALVACYARTGSPKFDQAAVRWLERLAAERDTSLRDIRLAAASLEALQTKQHDLAEKVLLRFLS
jgi:hypothetical protein